MSGFDDGGAEAQPAVLAVDAHVEGGPLEDIELDPAESVEDIESQVERLEISLYQSLDGADVAASTLAENARRFGMRSAELRCTLIQADALARAGDIPGAVDVVRAVRDAAITEGLRVVIARCHAVMATALDRVGARANSLDEAEQAVRLLDDGSPLHLQVDHMMTFALLTSSCRSGTRSFDLFERALELAYLLGEPIMQLAVLNNIAWVQYESGDAPAARATVEDILAVAGAAQIRLNLSTIDTVARVLFESGDVDGAEIMLRAAIDGPVPAPQTDPTALPAALLSLAAIVGSRSGPGAEREPLEACLGLAMEHGLVEMEALALRELARVAAVEGNFAKAYETHVRFSERWEQLRATEGEAQAAALQALYDTELARRRSRELEQLAQRDPLTGLWNRRYMTDRLPRLIDISRRSGRPLSIAVADLDHFKKVNDKLSHETGDRVLVATARVLRQVIEPSGFVVRVGGEEFLLAFPGCGLERATTIAEDVCRAMRDHDWSDDAGTWPITVSIGVASLEESGDIAQLIAAGDTNMYQAKREGRDRVVSPCSP